VVLRLLGFLFLVRCYLTRDGHIVAVEMLDKASDDEAALLHATAIFVARMGEFEGFEIWDGSRVVYRFPDEAPARSVARGR
jgi:hypothetical protein